MPVKTTKGESMDSKTRGGPQVQLPTNRRTDFHARLQGEVEALGGVAHIPRGSEGGSGRARPIASRVSQRSVHNRKTAKRLETSSLSARRGRLRRA